MRNVRKSHGEKVILDDVSLSFYPGAKIGVVGPNGAGKSTVLNIMAGLDQPSNGDATLTQGYTVGILSAGAAAQRGEDGARQRRGGRGRDARPAPPLQRDRRAHGDGLQRRAAHRDGHAAGAARPPQRLGPRQPARAGDGRAALPAAGRRRDDPLRRRAPPGRAVQAAAPAARPAAARRADEPPRRRERAVARAAPVRVPRRRPGRDARPVLPRQRRPVDPRDRPRPALPVRGQLLDLPRDQARAAQGRGPEGRQAQAHP